MPEWWNRLAKTVNDEIKASTIASRERLDLAIDTLVNQDNALILSLGEAAIGHTLDQNDNAIGTARLIQNESATIELLGDAVIAAESVLNRDIKVKTRIREEQETFDLYGKEDPTTKKVSQWYRIGVDGEIDHANGQRRKNATFTFYDKSKGKISAQKGDYWQRRQFTQTRYIPESYDEAPAKLLIGGNLHLNREKVLNQYSQLLVGAGLYFNQQPIDQTETNILFANGQLINEDLTAEQRIENQGYFYRYKQDRRRSGKRRRHKNFFDEKIKETLDEPLLENVSFNLVLNTIGNPLAKSGASIETKVSAKEIELETVTITPTEQSNLQDMSTVMGDITDGKPVNISLTPFLAENDKHQIVNSGQVIGKLDTMVNGLTQEKFDNLKLPVIKTHLTDIRLPQASLYTVNPDSPKRYLVETDPKFTQRKQWLSSNYMFNALRYHHDNTHKRLGDGFYEQQLINEQINQLTGRRYLHGFHNDMEQYKALMNSGVKYAKQFNLAVGIGLTAQQMSALTTDMVWLVNKEVTLADGRKLTVLTPQVYLVARDGDIDSRGAVISANEIISKVGSLKNTGVIAGRYLVNIKSALNQDIVLDNGLILSNKKLLINSKGNLKLDNGSAIRVLDEDAQLSFAANRIFQSADSVIENLRSEITTIFERYPEFDEEPTSLFRRAKTKGEEYILNKVSNGLPKEDVQKYADAANALTKASEGIPLDDRNYASIKESENRGNSDELKSYRERLLREQDSVISYWGSKAISAYRYSENDKKQDVFRREHTNFELEVANVLFNPSNKVKLVLGSVKGALNIFSSTEKALSGAKNTVSKMGGLFQPVRQKQLPKVKQN